MALRRKKKIIIGVSALVVLVLVVVISVIATRKDEPEVTTVKVDLRPELKSTVTASGEVRPIQYIKLTSEVPGRILEIFVNPGDIVKKNQALVRVDPTQLQSSQEAQWAATQASLNDVSNARNAVASAQQGLAVTDAAIASARQQVIAQQTAVDRAVVDLNAAQRELKRTTELIEKGVASRFDYDAARDRYEQTRIALETAKSNLESQRLAVKEAQERGNQQRTAIKEAQTGIKSSEMRASQQQAFLCGQSSQREKATQYSPLNGVVADIPTKTKSSVIAVPLQAIVEKAPPAPSPGPSLASSAPTTPGEKPKEQKGMYILDKDNKVKFVEVVTGITGESDIEVSSGLPAGSEVITGPSRVLKSLKVGDKVKKQTRKPDANANSGGGS